MKSKVVVFLQGKGSIELPQGAAVTKDNEYICITVPDTLRRYMRDKIKSSVSVDVKEVYNTLQMTYTFRIHHTDYFTIRFI